MPRQSLIRALSERDPSLDYLKTLQEEESFFSNIHVLMGVEIKPNPGVHLLIVFSENIAPNQVKEFLSKGLNKKYEDFNGNPEPMLNWTIGQTLDHIENTFGDDAFVIAPHADSTGGLYQGLKDLAQARIEAFTHNCLKAVSFNNDENRVRIQNLLSSKEYKRNSPLAFIQSSDFHGQPGYSIGSMHSKLHFDDKKINFSNLNQVLKNQKNIKCSVDFVHETYEKLIAGNALNRYESYSNQEIFFQKDDFRSLSDCVCAYLNTTGGVIEIRGSLNSFEEKSQKMESFQEKLSELLNEKIDPTPPTPEIKTLQLANSKLIILVRYSKSNKLYMSDGKVFLWKNDGPCPATPNEIETVVAKNLSIKYGRSESRKLGNLSYEAKRLSRIQLSNSILVKTRVSLSNDFGKIFSCELSKATAGFDGLDDVINESSNGVAEGAVCAIVRSEGPRLDNSYYRYTTPCYDYANEIDGDTYKTEDNKIIVTAGGGANFLPKGKYFFTRRPCFEIKAIEESLDLLPYISWMKSSFFIWQCIAELGRVDFFSLLFSTLSRVKLPDPKIREELWSKIENETKNIIVAEKVFLKEIKKILSTKDDEKFNKAVANHNHSIEKYLISIDFEIFKILGLSSKDAFMIYDDLKCLDIYCYNFDDNKDFKEKIRGLDNFNTCIY